MVAEAIKSRDGQKRDLEVTGDTQTRGPQRRSRMTDPHIEERLLDFVNGLNRRISAAVLQIHIAGSL